MAIEAAVIQFRKEIVPQFEQSSSLLRMTTTKESVMNGLQATFLVAGANGETATTRGTNGQVQYTGLNTSQLTATLAEYHAGKRITGFNVFASQGDLTGQLRRDVIKIINRRVDTTILDTLSGATLTCGAAATASLALVLKAKTILGNNEVPTEEEDNMFGVITNAFDAYLMQAKEYASADYVDMKPFTGPTRKMKRWAGINWIVHPKLAGVGTSSETCYLYHRSALGYAINMGEEKIFAGFNEEHTYSWAHAEVYDGGVKLQNTGIVKMLHDGSAYVAS